MQVDVSLILEDNPEIEETVLVAYDTSCVAANEADSCNGPYGSGFADFPYLVGEGLSVPSQKGPIGAPISLSNYNPSSGC